MFYYDSTILLVIPALILSLYAQYKVSSAYKKYSATRNIKGYTGADVARQLLLASDINDVRVEPIHGNLTDHYDPKSKVLRLSEGVYNSQSLAAVGIAAHETGHAIQHNIGYAPLGLRSALVPAANVGSRLAIPLIFIGFLLSAGSGSFGMLMINAGIILYTVAVAFTLITLPVEFNASGRAIELLSEYHFLTPDEITPAKKVLNAAALTYVAAALSAVLTLLRFVIMANSRRD
ncbi:MAG: zinc metallopeptidase [Clostridiales bacterium]|jgi:Zn-dependent membrane protease YugP|nr:zinc metallopeptidase [Clostridiales bacterium]